jgi:hypothetical protein
MHLFEFYHFEYHQNKYVRLKSIKLHMKKKITVISLSLFLLLLSVSAQVAMGKWRTHFAYNNVSQIAQSATKIYAVSEGALFSIDKQDGENGLEFYSKLNGLNGSNISRIEYDTTSQSLLIVYSNGNIDLLTSGGVINIPDLYNKQMSASKDVNQIQFYQGKAYLACNFGIVVINMQKKEIADTYFIGPNASEVKVLSTTIHNGVIYAVTPAILYNADINNSHLVNYEFWSSTTGLPGSGDFQGIASFSNKLIIQRGGNLYKQESTNSWSQIITGTAITNFNVTTGSLNIFDGKSVYLVDKDFVMRTMSNIGTVTDTEYDDVNNTYWYAANELGVIKQIGTSTPETPIKPAGPAVNSPWDMTFSGKKLYVVPGGRWADRNSWPAYVMMYENEKWTNINGADISAKTGYNVLDFMNVAVDPKDDKHFFATSYGTGLYEFKNNAFINWYNNTNSSIETIIPSDPFNYMRLDGAVFDQDGNLFFTNSIMANGIKVRLANGEWTKLTYPCVSGRATLGKIMISNQNPHQKWVPSVRYNQGVSIFDDNGTITNQADDKSVLIQPFVFPETDSNGKTIATPVYPTYVYTIAQDKNGVVWVGTDIGPFLFQNLSKVYDADYMCSRVKIPRNDSTNLADYLLVNERIKAIAIDGANRKWLGTESSGVYLMSENGQETIKHFTDTNSPLLSNDILSIAINPATGEVFFGTGKGIVSYQSDAGEAGETFNNVYAYPNPVREGFAGIITITGLVADTQVRITDINGNLVCQTISNGSIATWDGKDVHGRKVSTGVYLAMCTSSDGTQSAITKILVIN